MKNNCTGISFGVEANRILGSIFSRRSGVSFAFSESVDTACVDLKAKHIMFPIFAKSVPMDVTDHLLSHECAHIIYSEPEFIDQLQKRIGFPDSQIPRIQQIWNVIEDARIEKLMKENYAGLHKIYEKSYNHLFNKVGMFQVQDDFGKFIPVTEKNIKNQPFLVRVNVHFKIGHIIDVPFNQAEQVVVEQIKDARTQNEVYDLVELIFEDQEDQMSSSSEENQGDSGSNDSPDDGEDQFTPTQGPSSSFEDHPEDRLYHGEIKDSDQISEIEYEKIPLASNVKSNMSGDIDFLEFDVNGFTPVDSRKNSIFRVPDYFDVNTTVIQKTKKFSSTAASIFMSKQRAREYSNIREYRTGRINPQKIWKTKTDPNNVFLTKEITRTGKNHGIAIFIDISSSMTGKSMEHLAIQLLNTIYFCDAVQIPYVVYTHRPGVRVGSACSSTIRLPSSQRAEIIFSSNMRGSTLKDIKRKLSKVAMSSYDTISYAGSTAMECTMVECMKDVRKFKDNNGIDIMHTIVMTDGQDNNRPSSLSDSGKWISKNTLISLDGGKVRLDFSSKDGLDCDSMNMVAEIFGHYTNSNMTFVKFKEHRASRSHGKKLSDGIDYYEKDFGFRKNFIFYVNGRKMQNKPLANHMSIPEATNQKKNNSLFINIFASAIAEGDF